LLKPDQRVAPPKSTPEESESSLQIRSLITDSIPCSYSDQTTDCDHEEIPDRPDHKVNVIDESRPEHPSAG
jgi:hypothetical protein